MRLAIAALLIASSAAAADGVALAIPAKGAPAFTVTAPAGWSTAAGGDGSTTILPGGDHPHIQVWAVDKPDVEAAAAAVATLIVPQVKDFKAAKTSDATIAGGKAKVLVGTGTEADDGDPANAEVTVFAAAGKVWVLVNHAEGDGPGKKAADVAAMLQTLK